jgi:hypothetical protein
MKIIKFIKEFGIQFIILVVPFIISTTLYAQKYDKSPIPISDIKKGFLNLDYFRSILLEKGFKFEKSDSTTVYNEFWKVPAIENGRESYLCQLCIQITNLYFDKDFGKNFKKDVSDQLKRYRGLPSEKWIIIQIRKDILPEYAKMFQILVSTDFPLKKTQKIEVTNNDGKEPRTDYKLIYYNTDSKIKVGFSEDNTWMKFDFTYTVNNPFK